MRRDEGREGRAAAGLARLPAAPPRDVLLLDPSPWNLPNLSTYEQCQRHNQFSFIADHYLHPPPK